MVIDMKCVMFEFGGKLLLIVCDDVDFDVVVLFVVVGVFINVG